MVCRQLGFQLGGHYGAGLYGQGTGEIALDNVACDGTEASLDECSHSKPYDHNCGHSEDLGIHCYGKGSHKHMAHYHKHMADYLFVIRASDVALSISYSTPLSLLLEENCWAQHF